MISGHGQWSRGAATGGVGFGAGSTARHGKTPCPMNRLRSSADIERVRREGRSYAHPLVVVIAASALPAPEPQTRAAVVAGRKIGGAVVHNRAKRLLREALRSEPVKPGWDLLLIARAAIVGAPLVKVRAALHQMLQRAELSS